ACEQLHIFQSIKQTYFGRSNPMNVHNVRIHASKEKDSNRKTDTSTAMGAKYNKYEGFLRRAWYIHVCFKILVTAIWGY
ncbi:MAG TPA: hypothetical protein VFS31_15860, partial [Chitinophagaceae bacterium]|nr:hypothetical protein [Chitinophagaceae bacterium]